jgi:hypothetical protein
MQMEFAEFKKTVKMSDDTSGMYFDLCPFGKERQAEALYCCLLQMCQLRKAGPISIINGRPRIVVRYQIGTNFSNYAIDDCVKELRGRNVPLNLEGVDCI